mgnify:CR=1 FL=1
MNELQQNNQQGTAKVADEPVLGCVFVINFDESIIFKTNKDLHFYDKHYQTFEEAKNDLISYWDNLVSDAKRNLYASKKMKIEDVESF